MNILNVMAKKAVIVSATGFIAIVSSNASAFGFEWGDVEGSVDVLMSAGVSVRNSDVDYSIVSK